MGVPFEVSPKGEPASTQHLVDTTLEEVQSYLDLVARSPELAGVQVQTQALIACAFPEIQVMKSSCRAAPAYL
jgi:hypothetical protein